MKHIALLGFAALALSACTTPGTHAPNLASASEPQETAAAASATSGTAADLAKLGSVDAPASVKKEAWKDLDETSRYLLIMGTVDGFAAAGEGGPCYPGNDNARLDARLTAKGFGAKHPDTLPAALAALSAPKNECVTRAKRGYTSDLLKSMTDDHLATYLSAVVRAYAHLKSCPADNHGYAAATIAGDLFTLQTPKDPVELIGPAMTTSCTFKAE